MHMVFVTEIWGKTCHVDTMADAFRKDVSDVTVVDPYGGAAQSFSSEDEAYAHYLDVCGQSRYARLLSQALVHMVEPVFLVGFSAGAGAVWSVISNEKCGNVRGAACFYGSSIRTMLENAPTVPTDLIFPNHEPHFSVDEVIQALKGRSMVQCHKTQYGHGFMNPLSVNYDKKASVEWRTWIEKRVSSILDESDGLLP